MSTAEQQELTYDRINDAWSEAGIGSRLVMNTPGWEAAVASVQQHIEGRGWPLNMPPMGPVGRDSWSHWIHILSHCMKDGHGVSHADCELQLANLVIDALQLRINSNRERR